MAPMRVHGDPVECRRYAGGRQPQQVFFSLPQAVGRGESDRDIAFRLNLREPTVKTHLSRIFKKTGLRNRCQLTVALKESPPEGLAGIRIIV